MYTEFTAQVRKEIKKSSKARVTESWGRCIGIQLLYLVPFVLLGAILYVVLFGRAFSMLAQGVTDEYRISLAVMQGTNSIWVVSLFSLLISGPLQYGLMQFYIGLQRGREPGVGTLLQPFASLHDIWAGIRMVFCLFFRGLLWTIGPAVVCTCLLVWAALNAVLSGRMLSDGAILAIWLLYTAVLIPIEIKLLTYQAGWVLLHDGRETSVWDATGKASRAFKGQYGKLFVFELSFIGWYLLPIGVTCLCLLVGLAGLKVIAGATGIAVLVLALVAALCLDVVIGGFVSAYTTTAFIGMYEYLAAPAAGEDIPPQDGSFWQPPSDGSGL